MNIRELKEKLNDYDENLEVLFEDYSCGEQAIGDVKCRETNSPSGVFFICLEKKKR